MSKGLEDLIKVNREEFDDLEPSADLWGRIEQHLPPQYTEEQKREMKTFSLGFVLRVAATVIIVMGISFALYLHNSSKNGVDLAAINPQYARQQVHYTSLIESKRTELKSIEKSDPALYKEFNSEITKMDSTYKQLNKELPNSPNQEQVLLAMIHNLEIQTQVLNRQLQVIEQFNQIKKEQKNESKDI